MLNKFFEKDARVSVYGSQNTLSSKEPDGKTNRRAFGDLIGRAALIGLAAAASITVYSNASRAQGFVAFSSHPINQAQLIQPDVVQQRPIQSQILPQVQLRELDTVQQRPIDSLSEPTLVTPEIVQKRPLQSDFGPIFIQPRPTYIQPDRIQVKPVENKTLLLNLKNPTDLVELDKVIQNNFDSKPAQIQSMILSARLETKIKLDQMNFDIEQAKQDQKTLDQLTNKQTREDINKILSQPTKSSDMDVDFALKNKNRHLDLHQKISNREIDLAKDRYTTWLQKTWNNISSVEKQLSVQTQPSEDFKLQQMNFDIEQAKQDQNKLDQITNEQTREDINKLLSQPTKSSDMDVDFVLKNRTRHLDLHQKTTDMEIQAAKDRYAMSIEQSLSGKTTFSLDDSTKLDQLKQIGLTVEQAEQAITIIQANHNNLKIDLK